MKYGIEQFLLDEYLEESPNCVIYTKHLLLIINLREQEAYEFDQFSNLAKKNGNFAHLSSTVTIFL